MPEVIRFKTATLSDLGAEPAQTPDCHDRLARRLGTRFDERYQPGVLKGCWYTCRSKLRMRCSPALSAPGSRLAFGNSCQDTFAVSDGTTITIG